MKKLQDLAELKTEIKMGYFAGNGLSGNGISGNGFDINYEELKKTIEKELSKFKK